MHYCFKLKITWLFCFVFSLAFFLLYFAGVKSHNATTMSGKSSPVQGQVVYSTEVTSEHYTFGGEGRHDLFLRHIPQGGDEKLIDHQTRLMSKLGGALQEPAFSPDGKRVLFLSDYEGSSEYARQTMTGVAPYPYTLLNVWMVNLASRSVAAATRGEFGWRNVKWSPNGRFFCALYQTRAGVAQDTVPDDLYIFDAYSLNKRKVNRPSGVISYTTWSEDSTYLMFQIDSRVYMVSSTQGNVEPQEKWAHLGALSPDGQSMAYINYLQNSSNICIVQPNSENKTVLHTGVLDESAYVGHSLSMLSWSPDSKALALIEEIRDYSSNSLKMRLHIADPNSGSTKPLVTIPVQSTKEFLRWSKNASWIIVWVHRIGQKPTLSAISVTDGNIIDLMEFDKSTDTFDWREI